MTFDLRGTTRSQDLPGKAVALAALFAVLGVLWVSTFRVPSASAQSPLNVPYYYGGYNFGNPYGGYGYGYNNNYLLNNYGSNYGNYGYNGYNYGNYGSYGYNGYNYGNPYSSYGRPGGCLLACYGSNYYGYNTTAGAASGYATSNSASYAGTTSVPRTYNLSGRYCTDASGGQVWVAAGGSTSGLTC